MNGTNSKRRVNRPQSDICDAIEPEGLPASHPTVHAIMKAYEADMRLLAERATTVSARVDALQAAQAAHRFAQRYETLTTDEAARAPAQSA